ncbi:hypothetical protein BKA93DRAFT_451530 [Sparassis latifolia]
MGPKPGRPDVFFRGVVGCKQGLPGIEVPGEPPPRAVTEAPGYRLLTDGGAIAGMDGPAGLEDIAGCGSLQGESTTES